MTMLEYKYLFPEFQGDKHGEILSLISGVDFEVAFPIIARLNFIVREGQIKNYVDEVVFWFGDKSPLVNQYLFRIEHGYGGEELAKLRLLNIWSNLTLLQYFLEVYGQSENIVERISDIAGTHERLFKAYLLINEIYVANFNSQKVVQSVPKGVGVIMMMGLTMTAMLLPYHDLNHIDDGDAMITQFVKAVYFFQFAEANLPDVLEVFLGEYGVGNWKEYFKAIFPVVDHAFKNNKDGLAYLTVNPNNPRAETSRLFLKRLAIDSHDSGFSQHDFILPRSKPLLQINSEKFVIVDNLLVYNKMYNSLFFEFNAIIKANRALFTKGDFKGYLNDEFSESFLAKQVLNSIFAEGKYIRFSGDEIRREYAPDFIAEPDYYARNFDNIFLFELKDTFVSGLTKQSFNIERIIAELKSKLWYKETPKKGRIKEEPKAVRQLINNIKRAVFNELPFDKDLENKYLTFYPVLLFVDQGLSTPGINEIINHWFQQELLNDPDLLRLQVRIVIKPLTMIDVDTLIIFQDDFKSGKFQLDEFISKYWAYKEGFLALGKLGITQAVYDSTLTFGAFLRSFRKKRKTPAIFMEFGRLLFDKKRKS